MGVFSGSIVGMPATLPELEARVAALEAQRVDYQAVLAAVNAIGANQRDQALRITRVEDRLDRVEDRLDKADVTAADTNARVRSLEDNMAEMKDLLIRTLDR